MLPEAPRVSCDEMPVTPSSGLHFKSEEKYSEFWSTGLQHKP